MDLKYQRFHKEFVKQTSSLVENQDATSAQGVANVFYNMIAENYAVKSPELDNFQQAIDNNDNSLVEKVNNLASLYFPRPVVDSLYQVADFHSN